MIYKDAYAINGSWFFHKSVKGKLIEPSEEIKKIVYNFFEHLNNTYKSGFVKNFDFNFILDTFSLNGGKDFVPSFWFQASFKNRELAIEVSNEIINFIKQTFNSDNVIIIIASSDIDDKKHDQSLAYIRSGTYLESPEMWIDKMKDKNIIILEGEHLRKIIKESVNDIEVIFDRAYAFILLNNKGDSNVYHNNKHMNFVFQQCMIMYTLYKKEYDLKSQDKINLGLAALFHDFNHSGGKYADDINIANSIKGLKDFLIENPDIEVDIEKIIEIIQATEFPHKEINLSILQKIIRDADTTGTFSDNWFEIISSIAAEYKIEMKDFIPTQIKFVNNVEYYTQYCKNIKNKRKDIVLKTLDKLYQELN